ncbi:MAG: hypothetical protein JOZ38_03680 [Candidatus Eremiobacteraeota bacterium]|nr:hypothetical protein [Candidatus Eremiobacteraeota bacterium]
MSALAEDKPDLTALMKPVAAFAAAFNRVQTAYPTDAFADSMVVLDQFGPFVWDGTGGAHDWWSRLVGRTPEEHARLLVNPDKVVFGNAQFVNVSRDGTRAYFNVPSTLTYTLNGKAIVQRARYVFAEQKFDDGWKIVASAWAVESDTSVR